ncbi:cupin domain-containing protein [Pseudorhodoferax sp. Leaf267]|uniref:cupin domain-containing protein n=1 Tax=Pseudorhodoferax sp. Leaf267 TaxID=1736316 RepID=UPI0007017421|nr:cupin domain-containing protein [Pseudorhodoferax sp. Leaf267]KQP23441.1 hypothetical protein ASF43_06170 [Pseudorhodoferax sp. Leaf267]
MTPPLPDTARTHDSTPAAPQPPHLRSHYLDTNAMDWQPTQFEGITMKLLYADPATGMSTIMFKMEPGSVVPLHEHTSIEQTYMIEGSLEDAEGAANPGGFVWRPGGNMHVAKSPGGAVFISFFTKPNRFLGGEKFFTEASG